MNKLIPVLLLSIMTGCTEEAIETTVLKKFYPRKELWNRGCKCRKHQLSCKNLL